MNAIEVNHMYKKIGDFQLRDLSFNVEQGTVMGFIGQNGAGKTTTIKCILNSLKITTGNISVFGKNHAEHELDIKENIGVVFDELHVPDSLTAIDLDKFYGNVYKRWDRSYFFNLLERLDVSKYTKVKDLSRGMKMKLSLALALSHHPKLLILDEPTSGLDPIIRDEVLDILLGFMEDESHSILFSSHITTDLEKIADTITFIHKGEIVFSESKDVLLYEYGLWKGTEEQAKEIPSQAILGKRKSAFGVELLVNRNYVSPAFTLEKPTIDDIMIFFVKGA